MPGEKLAVLILAAGNSERMGCDKATLPFGNGLTFAEQLISAYSGPGFGPIIIVVNKRTEITFPVPANVRYVLNENVAQGRSWSVRLGLQNIPPMQGCFVQNVDSPFTDPALLKQMQLALKPGAYVVPVFGGRGGHPVLLGSLVVDELRKKEEIPNLREALEEYERVEVPSNDNRIHLNINTPAEYREFILHR